MSSDTQALPIKRSKIIEKKIDMFGNILIRINSLMDGKINWGFSNLFDGKLDFHWKVFGVVL